MLKRFAVIFALIISLSFIHLVIVSKTVIIGNELDISNKIFNKLASQNKDLEARAAKEESLQRIESIARNKLGMITPEKINYIIVSSEGSAR